jgi:probable F420-dependent oxidoreductase
VTADQASTPGLGRFGVSVGKPISPERAREIERLGYGAVWVGGSPAAGLAFVEPILAQTTSLVVATGIVNVWSAPAKTVAESFHRIDALYPGRFLLGLGVGHPEHTDTYRRPYEVLVEYLDELDAAGVPTSRRLLAALGPKVLELSARRSAGALPALTTPQHTALAREVLGPTKILAPQQAVLFTSDVEDARRVGRQSVSFYLGLSNYVNNWRRLGFSDADLTRPGSDRLVDAMFAYGSADDIAKRLTDHLDAGADHVALYVEGEALMPTLTGLSTQLGLAPFG